MREESVRIAWFIGAWTTVGEVACICARREVGEDESVEPKMFDKHGKSRDTAPSLLG